ncbi:NmrA family NAD(P)-binding protein [Pseudarthrobacter sp. 1G09]|uniref:NmrA family NAD(P)-binding protein n=1 Tax=Pseudarthrobacter sp. 1G09 TaxID=3416178 RepID=UPI003CE9B2B0
MTNEIPSARSRDILIIGAGELGMPVLRNVARRARDVDGSSVSVLLRASAIESVATDKQRDLAELRNLGVRIVQGDLVKNTVDELATIFANYDTVIGCTGITAGLETPMKVAQAASSSETSALLPLAVRC